MKSRRHIKAKARLAVTARVMAGTLGAYGLTLLVTIVLSLLLALGGMDRAQAVIAATLASFAVFAAISVAVFHAASATRAWGWLLGAAAPLVLAAFALSQVAR